MRLLLLGMGWFVAAFLTQMILVRFLIEQGNYEWFELCYEWAFVGADFCLTQIVTELSRESCSICRIYLSFGIYSLGISLTLFPLWTYLHTNFKLPTWEPVI